ncbi:MAG: hypothetical protein CMJ24_11550 [Phycisphaerae bacterium]|nr:hypothetical protein [Phycisphaerae bacterium]
MAGALRKGMTDEREGLVMASIQVSDRSIGRLVAAVILSGCCLCLMALASPSPKSAPPADQLVAKDSSSDAGERGSGCGSCSSGAFDESEPCGTQINGGCDDQSFSNTTISCGTEVCGRSWAQFPQGADIDWYEVFLPDTDFDSEDMLKIKVESQLPLIIEVYDGCFANPLAVVDSDGCDEGYVSLCLLAPKVYYIRILPGSIATGPIFSGYPCVAGFEYTMNVECEPACTTTPSCPTCTPAPESLVAWWAMDDDAAATSIYELVNGNHAAVQGSVAPGLPGKVEEAVEFTGGHLVAPDQDRLDFKADGDFSVITWLKLPNDPVGVHPIIDKRTPEGLAKLGWTVTSVNGKIILDMADATGASDNWSSGTPIDDGEWHHVAVTVDRSTTDGLRLYIDGTLVAVEDPTTVDGDLSTTSDTLIGRSHRLDGQSTEPVLQGRLDELQVYHRSLTGPEVARIVAADCGGTCKVRMHVTRVTPFCEGQAQADSIVTISNATEEDRWFDLNFDGVLSDPNGTDYCLEDGPTGFTPGLANPIFVPGGSTVEVPVAIDIPSGLQVRGDSACWTVTCTEAVTGFEIVRKGTVSVSNDVCAEAETNGVLSLPVGIPTPIKFTLINQTSADQFYPWRISCVKSVGGQLNDMVRLNSEEPGDELFGSTVVPAGGSVDIIVDVLFLRQRGKSEKAGYSDVVIARDPGSDVPWYGDDSQGVDPAESSIESCGADINCDGVVDVTDLLAVIAAWGDCPEGDDCLEDTNDDGVVDVTDLLAVIAGWGA